MCNITGECIGNQSCNLT
ncbi:hypothetical protein GOC83_17515 [Haloarcula rubripromontorii]|uniref:Uncharacterized protein n=1 Tax=Haloarcula rubripromontorii TaxID=1705562 RepID=A0A847TXF5_9EURY|nr:hypothetical protein [Haloarcula rubripromontorii]